MIGIFLAYAVMILAVLQGSVILETLHGPDVSHRALAQAESQSLIVDYPQICSGYSTGHFNSNSNVLHAIGMVATMWLSVYATTLSLLGFGNPKHFLYLPILYYLPAWYGHFVIQKDLPSEFVYGTSLDAWVNWETCAWEDLFRGGTIRNSTEFAYTVGSTVVLLGALMTLGGLWPTVHQPSRVKVD